MSALDVRDLVIDYQTRRGPVRAVEGFDISIEPGQLVAVVGETGSGKTTAALASIGLLPDTATRTSGSISVGGRDTTGWNRRRWRTLHGAEIGLIPQDPTASLDPLKTIGWQVGESLRIRGRTKQAQQRVLELLEQVGFLDAERIATSYPHQLSGGLRQRALIAGAIALEPVLLVADESTSALDVTVQRKVLDLLDTLRAEHGTGMLLVTHDLAVAAERADYLVVLRDGHIQDAGPVHQILSGGTHHYTRQLISHAPALRQAPTRPSRRKESDQERTAIKVRSLCKRFSGSADVQAVADVSFCVQQGTTHAIVGESGSGKSTIARLILGLEKPSAGSVIINGSDISAVTRRDQRLAFRKQVQLVYQSPYASLNPSMSIISTVAEPLKGFSIASSRADARKRAAALLERVALPAALHDRRPRELSGGQRQRVAIARALAADPEILVLDEPVSALDVSVQAQILDLLDELQRERGLTYVFISHDLSVVRQISDTVTVLHAGLVQESGDAASIFASPQAEYTRELLNAIPHVEPSLLHH